MDLTEFLIEARKNSYVSDESIVKNYTVLEDGFREFVFSKENFTYRDRFCGWELYVGEETVFQDGKSVWALNYYGELLSPSVSSQAVYDFLGCALTEVSAKAPCRGPKYFYTDKFAYLNHMEGGIERFIGREHILLDGEEIYRLFYHGGSLK